MAARDFTMEAGEGGKRRSSVSAPAQRQRASHARKSAKSWISHPETAQVATEGDAREGQTDASEAVQIVQFTTRFATVMCVIIACIKVGVYMITKANVMKTSALDSMGDLMANGITLYTGYRMSQPDRRRYPVGLGKFESLGCLVFSTLMFALMFGNLLANVEELFEGPDEVGFKAVERYMCMSSAVSGGKEFAEYGEYQADLDDGDGENTCGFKWLSEVSGDDCDVYFEGGDANAAEAKPGDDKPKPPPAEATLGPTISPTNEETAPTADPTPEPTLEPTSTPAPAFEEDEVTDSRRLSGGECDGEDKKCITNFAKAYYAKHAKTDWEKKCEKEYDAKAPGRCVVQKMAAYESDEKAIAELRFQNIALGCCATYKLCLWLFCILIAIPKSKSNVLVALATDKRNDFMCTYFVIFSTFLLNGNPLNTWHADWMSIPFIDEDKTDAFISLILSLFIMYSWVQLLLEHVGLLSQGAADDDFTQGCLLEARRALNGTPCSVEASDLIVYQYACNNHTVEIRLTIDQDQATHRTVSNAMAKVEKELCQLDDIGRVIVQTKVQ